MHLSLLKPCLVVPYDIIIDATMHNVLHVVQNWRTLLVEDIIDINKFFKFSKKSIFNFCEAFQLVWSDDKPTKNKKLFYWTN